MYADELADNVYNGIYHHESPELPNRCPPVPPRDHPMHGDAVESVDGGPPPLPPKDMVLADYELADGEDEVAWEVDPGEFDDRFFG